MSPDKICDNTCKKFQVIKPKEGRYASGQCRCQTCDVWLDYRGCHLQDGTPATLNSNGWSCNCCNCKVRTNPRNLKFKTKIRLNNISDNTYDDNSKDESIENILTNFNKQRAHMMKNIARCILKKINESNTKDIEHYFMVDFSISTSDIELEFNMSVDKLIELAHNLDPPNKMSMILEFERVRSLLDFVPTKSDFEIHSKINIATYENEFQSWGHMLERLGYDPWYRKKDVKPIEIQKQNSYSMTKSHENSIQNLEDIRNEIQNELKNESNVLELFNMLDKKIIEYDKETLEKIIDDIEWN